MKRALRHGAVLAAIALTIPLSTAACSDAGAEQGATGSLEVVGQVTSALSAADVVSIDLQIVNNATSATTSASLTKQNDGTFAGVISGLVVGTYRISGNARDANGNALYQTSVASVAVTANNQTAVMLNFHSTARPGSVVFDNHAPFVDTIVADKSTVAPGETIGLRASASDSDGDALTYAWTGPGTFDDPKSASPHWTAPPNAGTVTLQLTVDDHRGATSVVHLTLTVQAAPAVGSIAATVRFLPTPQITAFTISNGQPASNESVQVSLAWKDLATDCPRDGSDGTVCTPNGAFISIDTNCTAQLLHSTPALPPGQTTGSASFGFVVGASGSTCVVTTYLADVYGATITGAITVNLAGPH